MFVFVELVEDVLDEDGVVFCLVLLEVHGDDERVVVVVDVSVLCLPHDVVHCCLEIFVHQLALELHAGS